MKVSLSEIVVWCEGQDRQKDDWLDSHGPRSKKPRPVSEADSKRRDKAVLAAIKALVQDRLRGAA